MKKLPEINQLVVMNHDEVNATLFRVKVTNLAASLVGMIDATIEDKHPNQRIQWVRKSLVLTPSIGQLANFNS